MRGSRDTRPAEDIWHLSIEDLFAAPQESQPLGGEGPYVLELRVSAAEIRVSKDGLGELGELHLYQLTREKGDECRYRLRLGPFTSELEADAMLAQVRQAYPRAVKALAEAEDLEVIERAKRAAAEQRRAAARPPERPRAPERPPVAAQAQPAKVAWDVDEVLAFHTRAAIRGPAVVPPAPKKPASVSKPAPAPPPSPPPAAVRPAAKTPTPAPPPEPPRSAPAAPSPAPMAPEEPEVDPNAVTDQVPIPTFDVEIAPEDFSASASSSASVSGNPVDVPGDCSGDTPEPVASATLAPVIDEAAFEVEWVPPPVAAAAAPPEEDSLEAALEVSVEAPISQSATQPAAVRAPELPVIPEPETAELLADDATVPNESLPRLVFEHGLRGEVALLEPLPGETWSDAVEVAAPQTAAPELPEISIELEAPQAGAPGPESATQTSAAVEELALTDAGPGETRLDAELPVAEPEPAVLTTESIPVPEPVPELESAPAPSVEWAPAVEPVLAMESAPAMEPVPGEEMQSAPATQAVPVEELCFAAVEAAGPPLELEAPAPLAPLDLPADDPSRWFVVQLGLSATAFDPDSVPHHDLFDQFRLYAVQGLQNGEPMYALRLGFFTEEIGAQAVAGYLAAYFDSPCVKRVSVQERERFSQRRLEARKDIGATGVHKVIELSGPQPIQRHPEVRVASTAPRQQPRSVWSRLVSPLKR